MGLEDFKDIKEIRECETVDEVNALLSNGNWRLIDKVTEKRDFPYWEKETFGNSDGFSETQVSTMKYEERLAIRYIMGRYK